MFFMTFISIQLVQNKSIRSVHMAELCEVIKYTQLNSSVHIQLKKDPPHKGSPFAFTH